MTIYIYLSKIKLMNHYFVQKPFMFLGHLSLGYLLQLNYLLSLSVREPSCIWSLLLIFIELYSFSLVYCSQFMMAFLTVPV